MKLAKFILIFLLSTEWTQAFDCHYDFTIWNTRTRTSLGPFKVENWQKDLLPFEKGPQGCTLCLEDQVTVGLSNGLSFTICKKVRHTFLTALENALKKKVALVSVLGYRPSKSKGSADANGLRTEFSQHAYGVAVDVNEEHNGLYVNCPVWSETCTLTKGGPYRPYADPASLTQDSVLVQELLKSGIKWGGEIRGGQKDFMHFSPDGY